MDWDCEVCGLGHEEEAKVRLCFEHREQRIAHLEAEKEKLRDVLQGIHDVPGSMSFVMERIDDALAAVRATEGRQ